MANCSENKRKIAERNFKHTYLIRYVRSYYANSANWAKSQYYLRPQLPFNILTPYKYRILPGSRLRLL